MSYVFSDQYVWLGIIVWLSLTGGGDEVLLFCDFSIRDARINSVSFWFLETIQGWFFTYYIVGRMQPSSANIQNIKSYNSDESESVLSTLAK